VATVYFDTSVWISAASTKDKKRFPRAREQFELVRTGANTLFVSNWVLLEIYKVLFDRAMRDSKVRGNPTRKNVEQFVKANFDNYVKTLLQMAHVEFQEPSVELALVLKEAREMTEKIFGDATRQPDCPVCHGKFDFFEYNGPYQIDFIHALIARELKCDKIVTFDTDYSLMQGDRHMGTLSIEVLKGTTA